MKKLFRISFLFLLIPLAAVMFFTFRNGRLREETKDQVAYTKTDLYGDSKNAAGVKVHVKNALQYRLIFDSDVCFRHDGSYDAATSVSLSKETLWRDEVFYGYGNCDHGCDSEYIDLYGVRLSGGVGFLENKDAEGNYVGIFKAIEELRDTLAPGERKQKKIRLADYYTYYPVIGEIFLPEISYGFHPDYLNYDPEENEDVRLEYALSDFFRIPVLENDCTMISACGSGNGSSVSSPSGTVTLNDASAGLVSVDTAYTDGFYPLDDADCFDFRTYSAVTEDAAFFWFPNRSSKGTVVDTSLIPGGYGIYILPYDTDIRTDELALFYPVPEESRILHLGLSADRKHLFLYAEEEGKVYLSVIDPENASLHQKLYLTGYDQEEEYTTITDCSGFSALYTYNKELIVIDTSEDQAAVVIRHSLSDYEKEAEFLPFSHYYSHCLNYSDGRFLITGSNQVSESHRETMSTGCGFYIAVFDADGLSYYGLVESSLTDTSIGTAGNFSTLVHPFTRTPVTGYFE